MSLDSVHLTIRHSIWFARLAVITRILLALAFLPSGIVKVLGERFTTLPAGEDAIGSFFEAMYRTGVYWQFLGWSQVIAAALILIPRTTTLGAFIFLPIIANIFVITVALHFTGTPIITGLMLVGVVFLLLWDFHKWKRIVFASPAIEPPPRQSPVCQQAEFLILGLGTAAGVVLVFATRGFVPTQLTRGAFIVGCAAAVALAVIWFRQRGQYHQ